MFAFLDAMARRDGNPSAELYPFNTFSRDEIPDFIIPAEVDLLGDKGWLKMLNGIKPQKSPFLAHTQPSSRVARM
jgi:hypothetical protein